MLWLYNMFYRLVSPYEAHFAVRTLGQGMHTSPRSLRKFRAISQAIFSHNECPPSIWKQYQADKCRSLRFFIAKPADVSVASPTDVLKRNSSVKARTPFPIWAHRLKGSLLNDHLSVLRSASKGQLVCVNGIAKKRLASPNEQSCLAGAPHICVGKRGSN